MFPRRLHSLPVFDEGQLADEIAKRIENRDDPVDRRQGMRNGDSPEVWVNPPFFAMRMNQEARTSSSISSARSSATFLARANSGHQDLDELFESIRFSPAGQTAVTFAAPQGHGRPRQL